MGYPTDEDLREGAIGPSPVEIRRENEKQYYECHVTLYPEWAEIVEPIAKMLRFKTSVLKGDEVMGDDKLLYCTSHAKSFDVMVVRMQELVMHIEAASLKVCQVCGDKDCALAAKGAAHKGKTGWHNRAILRKKIEHVVFDERFDR